MKFVGAVSEPWLKPTSASRPNTHSSAAVQRLKVLQRSATQRQLANLFGESASAHTQTPVAAQKDNWT
ncbi:unnamed protein product [Pleuronectes platessa]|uniref:Uncharacterized protein n=1 Tax=Pleuronectes platessa TaxID=8262 RepID=A0A9N7U366_PLEPL|nr:unnamed protein product [Pleuronectes platessa]